MVWTWWTGMIVAGLLLGCVGAWTQDAARVFMKTLSIPLVLFASRLLPLPDFPQKNAPLTIGIDIFLLAVFALVTDYLLGVRLGRNDRQGYREDSVGH